MNAELNIFGIFVPSILACAIIAYVAMSMTARGLRYLGIYRFVWHPSLFNLCIYVCLLGASVIFLKVY
ncbi:DUF1656 domain-containing protein [Hyphomicrobium sp. 2TAF46]|uniref:DUF1656 domain-containing protein n=1 Tax=Hyphomicrobium sp. 2TAF46 TaxID=3233019 RepID=UPI003F8F80A4